MRAGKDAVLGAAKRSVQLERDGVLYAEQIAVPRFRVEDDAFDRLAKRGQLDQDELMNSALASAGKRFRSAWRKAGLETLQGFDPSKGFTTNRSGGGLLGTERRCDAFDEYSDALDSVYGMFRPILESVLLKGNKLEVAGESLSTYVDKKICSALALTYLRNALKELARHYDQVDRAGAALA